MTREEEEEEEDEEEEKEEGGGSRIVGVRLRKEKEGRDLVGPPELARCASLA